MASKASGVGRKTSQADDAEAKLAKMSEPSCRLPFTGPPLLVACFALTHLAAVPEPTTWVLMISGLCAVALALRRRR